MQGPNSEVSNAPTVVTGGDFGTVIDATKITAQVKGNLNIQGALTVNGSPISGGGSPGGLNTQIQYNNAGAFAGASITTNGSGLSVPGDLHVDGNIYVSAGTDGQLLYKSGGVVADDAGLTYDPSTGLQIGATGSASLPLTFSQTDPGNPADNNGAMGYYAMQSPGESTQFNNTSVKQSSMIILAWYNTGTGSADRLGVLQVVTQSDGVFQVTSSNPADQGTYYYLIVNRAIA